MKTIIIIFSLLVITANNCTGGGLTWKYVKYDIKRKYPHVQQMTVSKLAATNLTTYLLIDVRTAKEYKVSHLKNAVNIESTKEILKLIKNKKKEKIILYCSVGYRSSDIANQLLSHGVTNIYNFEGSLFEWINSGHKVYDANGVSLYAHPYNKAWGLLLESKYHPQKSGH